MTDTAQFAPTLREVMLRGRWIGVLLLCLVLAGVFAFLGQWQLGRAINTNAVPSGATEEVRPLTEVVQPGEYVPEPTVGQRVETTGTWVDGDFIVVATRFNDGVQGYWVTGQLRVAERTSIAVALGWAADEETADAVAASLNDTAGGVDTEVTGRIISDEGGVLPPRADPYRLDRMSTAMLLSRWHDTENLDVYRPYLTANTAPAGLVEISSPAPEEQSPVHWLNLFYAAEWAIFAGCAFYLWYRLAKDAWEREVEEFEERETAASA